MSKREFVLPIMKCDRFCGACCKIVLVTQAEFNKINNFTKQHNIQPLRRAQCPWYQDGWCAIYRIRPLVCRLFGHINDEAMICQRGYNTNLSCKQAKKFLRKNVPANRLLHEVLPDWVDYIRPMLPEKIKVVTLGKGKYKRKVKL